MGCVAGERIGQLQRSQGLGVKDARPRLRLFERIDLFVADSSSSRRDNMAGQSSGALINDRRTHEQQLLERCWHHLVIRPERSAELFVRIAGALDRAKRVPERRAGQFQSNLHGASMAVSPCCRTKGVAALKGGRV